MFFYHDSAENEAIERLEDVGLTSDMSREFSPGVLAKISDEVLPDALKRDDKDLAQKCERVLAKYGFAYPNSVSGFWEPLDVPRSELQVREIFAPRLSEFGFRLVGSHTDYPDWLLIDEHGEYVYCEVEHRSSNFVLHGHDPARCDLIACWEHDWPESPLPVLEFFSGKVAVPNVAAPMQKSRAQLSVNFTGLLSTPFFQPKFAERSQRGNYAVKRFYELREDASLSSEQICRQIGLELGSTPSAVRQLLNRRDIIRRRKPSRREQMAHKYDEIRGNYDTKSAAINAVAAHFDVTAGTVWSHLSRRTSKNHSRS